MNKKEQQVDITKMSITELKALAYDQISVIESHQREINNCQANIKAINDQILLVSKTEELKKEAE